MAQIPATTPSTPQSNPTEAPDSLLRFLANSKDFDKAVDTKARATFTALNRGCTTIEKVVRQLPILRAGMTFAEPEPYPFAPPVAGQWQERMVVTGCGKTETINILAVAQGKKFPSIFATLPGTTVSDPAAQRDAENIAAFNIRKSIQACMSAPILLRADLIGYLDANNKVTTVDQNRGWFENWQFKHCEQNLNVQMAFTPATGGGFQIRARVLTDSFGRDEKPDTTVKPAVPGVKL